jgi:hypothetical protein
MCETRRGSSIESAAFLYSTCGIRASSCVCVHGQAVSTVSSSAVTILKTGRLERAFAVVVNRVRHDCTSPKTWIYTVSDSLRVNVYLTCHLIARAVQAVRLAWRADELPNFASNSDHRDSCLPAAPIATPSRNIIMSWRNNAGSTGSNNIPLGTRRRGGDANGSPEFAPPPNEGKRGRSPEPVSKEPELNPDGTKKRRKRNRWGDASDNKAAGLMNLPTAITAPMTAEQLDAYVTHLRIEEISQKLRINDVVPADGDR